MTEKESTTITKNVEGYRAEIGKEVLGKVVEIFGRAVLICEVGPSGLSGYPLTDSKGNTINTSLTNPSPLSLDNSMLIRIPTEQKELLEKHKKPAVTYLQKYHGSEDGKWAAEMLEILLPKFYDPEGGLSLKKPESEELIRLLLDLAAKNEVENLSSLTPANFTINRIIAGWEPLMVGERLIVDAPNQSEHKGSLYLNSLGGEVFRWEKESSGWVRLKNTEELWTYISPFLKNKIASLK